MIFSQKTLKKVSENILNFDLSYCFVVLLTC